ncbi:hypothetical protein SK128_028504 [Halocaridina rubra]|uniref:Uncharacterized protein n=1 Tax=Halocaridina rubra TaxID=373956 RepID=A0AAN8X7M9_HALRR
MLSSEKTILDRERKLSRKDKQTKRRDLERWLKVIDRGGCRWHRGWGVIMGGIMVVRDPK